MYMVSLRKVTFRMLIDWWFQSAIFEKSSKI